MFEVGTYPTRSDAESAQAALRAAGIPSVIAADDAGGAYPFVLGGGAHLFVGGPDAQEATTILAGPVPANRKERR